jgi:hypothetical protein
VEAATTLPRGLYAFFSNEIRDRIESHPRIDKHPRIDLTCAIGLPYGYVLGRDSMLGKFGVNPTLPSQL